MATSIDGLKRGLVNFMEMGSIPQLLAMMAEGNLHVQSLYIWLPVVGGATVSEGSCLHFLLVCLIAHCAIQDDGLAGAFLVRSRRALLVVSS